MLRSTLCLLFAVFLSGATSESYRIGDHHIASQNEERLAQLIVDLSSKDNANPRETRNQLVSLARRSPALRTEVIDRLIEVLEDARDIVEKGQYQAWYNAADILGELRAVEAIDVLVKYLDFTDGVVGLPLANRPAVSALVRIGEPAVPKLVNSLSEGRRISIRVNAAEALGFIGSRDAKAGLQRALITEQDKSVVCEVRRALSLISRRKRTTRS